MSLLQSELTLSLLEPLEQDGNSALLLQPKREAELSADCCQHNSEDSDPDLFSIAEQANEECRRDLALLMDQTAENFDNLDDLLGCKDVTKEVKPAESSSQGAPRGDTWWEESFTELFPSLLAV